MEEKNVIVPKSVLVIGGGITGIEAALNLAELGLQVYLVEESSTIGGLMARLDKTFPTNDCSICIQAPKMYEVQKHENIELLTNCDVRRVKPMSGGFKVRLVKKPRFVDEEKCKGCGKCEEVCPVTITHELDGKVGGERKLIYTPFAQAVPNVFLVDSACRFGKKRKDGACIGDCIIDCIQCRECPIALCVKACKDEGADALLLWQREEPKDIEVESIVVASGLDSFEPSLGHLGYDLHQNVITNLQFERMINSGGPTNGELVRPSDNTTPKNIAWIQCVGRGSAKEIPYCSKVCCMVSTKQSIITKEHHPEIETYILNHNLKTHGKGFYRFLNSAKEHGTIYLRGRPAEVIEDPNSQNLTIRYEDMELGEPKELEVDLLVLSTGLVSRAQNKKLSKILRLELDDHGFFKEKDPIVAPFETNVAGIYVCGGAKGPNDIAESVTQAQAAAIKAASSRWADGK